MELVRRRDAGVRRELTLSLAEKGNALSDSVVSELATALDTAERDGVRLIVLRGEGRNFCTGFDLSDIGEASDADLLARFIRVEMLLARVWTMPVPVIGVAHGRTWGAGADLFAACGRRLALSSARFAFPGSGFGLVLGARRLGVRIGADAARRLVSAGQEIDANSAKALGLVEDIVAEEALNAILDGEAHAIARPDAQTAIALSAALAERSGLVDADLANLVRSAVRPGLKNRIAAYRQASLAVHAAKPQTRGMA
jgi:enoyl-CoA hydratase